VTTAGDATAVASVASVAAVVGAGASVAGAEVGVSSSLSPPPQLTSSSALRPSPAMEYPRRLIRNISLNVRTSSSLPKGLPSPAFPWNLPASQRHPRNVHPGDRISEVQPCTEHGARPGT
jgi:hypothetical protein